MKNNFFSCHFKNQPSEEKIKRYYADCKKAAENLVKKINKKEIAAIDVVFDNKNLKLLKKINEEICKFKKVIILGVGGSSLGGKTLVSLKSQNRVEFLESIDPKTIKNCLEKIDYNNTFFLVISKSGETTETVCQTLIVIDEFQKRKIKNYQKNFLFITELKESSISKIAKKIKAKIIAHSEKIGGRFSCFSIVGILPAIIADLNVEEIKFGAQKTVENFLKNSEEIVFCCALQLYFYDQGVVNNVMMPYVDILKNFTDWYRQLWAESLGKNNFGSTPVNSMGTVDQHSQLQLYLDGPKDKLFTFIVSKNHHNDFLIKDLAKIKTLFGKRKISEIVKIEQDTTIEILNQKKLPIRIFEIEEIDEKTIGSLMARMFLETILIAFVKKINPFDQPAVELRKKIAKRILLKK
jgi:glucose-6-phosphate isomerase